jgi:hypothetical protein
VYVCTSVVLLCACSSVRACVRWFAADGLGGLLDNRYYMNDPRYLIDPAGTANEVPGLNVGADAPVKGYPTLRYFPSGHDQRYHSHGHGHDDDDDDDDDTQEEARGLEFTGGMTKEGIIAFIEEQEAQQAHMGHHMMMGHGGMQQHMMYGEEEL